MPGNFMVFLIIDLCCRWFSVSLAFELIEMGGGFLQSVFK